MVVHHWQSHHKLQLWAWEDCGVDVWCHSSSIWSLISLRVGNVPSWTFCRRPSWMVMGYSRLLLKHLYGWTFFLSVSDSHTSPVWEIIVIHSDAVSAPSKLHFYHHKPKVSYAYAHKDLNIGHYALPANVYYWTEETSVKLLELFNASSVEGSLANMHSAYHTCFLGWKLCL